jgi:sarcosine oxidase subunit gamma
MAESRPILPRPAVGAPVRRLPSASRLSLRVKVSGEETLGTVAGLRLDLPIIRFAAVDERLAARLGPDEWLIIGAPSQANSLNSAIAAALAGRRHAIVDVSQANVAFAVEGPDAPTILNAGCPLDLDSRHFSVGSATRTILGKSEIVLFRLDESEFRVECWRSFGEYVHAFLLEAAALNEPTRAKSKELSS